MGNFNRNNKFRGRDDRGDRQMFRTTCSDCGRDCEVPFRPTGEKPVYCSNCFRDDRGSRSDGGRGRRGEDRGGRRSDSRRSQEMHGATCADCGRSCEVPFRPSNDKPVYCEKCFGKGGGSNQGKTDQSGKKHEEINAKLDKILSLLQGMNSAPKVVEKEVVIKSKKDKVVKKAKVKETIEKTAKKKPASRKVAAKKTVKKKA